VKGRVGVPKVLKTAVVIMIAAAAPAAAQMNFGLVAGVVSSNPSISPESSVEMNSAYTGFVGGISLSRDLSPGLALAPEALYVMKGADHSEPVAGTTITTGTRISYIEVPVLFRYRIGERTRTHLFITAGPDISFKLSCSQFEGSAASMPCPDDTSDGFKSTDAGLMFGAGDAMRRISLSVRYDLGLNNISNDDAVSVKSRTIFGVVGLALGK
jgi:hypothetical protein